MKKLKLSDINFFNYLNDMSKRSFREQTMKTISLTGSTNQYIILSRCIDRALHNGIISIWGTNPANSLISIFSITVNGESISVNASNAGLMFYKLTSAGVDYVAILKPSSNMTSSSLQSFAVNAETYEFKELHAFNASNVIKL